MTGGRSYSSATGQTTLTADPGSGGTSLAVVDSTKFSALDGKFPWGAVINLGRVDQEVITVTARPDGTHLTVSRGEDGTTAAAHAVGATVDHAVSAREFNGVGTKSPDFWSVFGHSYFMYGFGTFYQSGRTDALFRAALDIEYQNWQGFAKDGAKLTYEGFAQGGYARVLQSVNRPLRGAPYAPDGGAYIICYGINDIGVSPGTQTEIRTAYKHALRTVLSRLRSATIYENDTLIGTRVAYGAGFSLATATRDFSSGSTIHLATTTTSATITMTLPSDYAGETVAMQFIANGGTFGGTVTFSGTAGVTGTLSTSAIINISAASHCPVTKRVTNLTSANAGQTIIATVTALDASGAVQFDSWWLESKYPQPIIVCNVARLTTAGYASYANTPTDTDVANLNTDIASVVAEFSGGMIQIADIDTAMNKDATLFAADGVHPNEIGAAKCVDACLAALNRLVPTDSAYPTINLNNSSPRAAPMRRPRLSGFYYSVEASDVYATSQPAVGDMWAAPYEITEGRERVFGFALRLATGGSVAGTIRWAIYDDPGWTGYPKGLVNEPTGGGALSLGTTPGIVKTPTSGTGSISIPLDPGLYWLVFKQATVGTGQALECLVGPDRTSIMPSMDKTTLAGLPAIAWKLTGQGAGALPAYFPDISSAAVDSLFPKMAALLF